MHALINQCPLVLMLMLVTDLHLIPVVWAAGGRFHKYATHTIGRCQPRRVVSQHGAYSADLLLRCHWTQSEPTLLALTVHL